ncbi:MAG: aminocarboxymuconate-semialdehyde decarboxylase [Solirubrobacteraceae bacterium]|jgi:aminocarboxymuconate-semialdehyde decarboxylase|nr:aminocarboxymuconate-semialdehyde decarboxylase [Solirubrobacteraceae bacterium]
MRIDAHAHVIVPEVLRDAAPHEAWRPRAWWEDGAQVVELGGRPIRSAVREFVDVDAILAAQDQAGIDHVVLSPWVALLGYDAPGEEGLERCRVQNAGLAGLQAAHPERVSVLGTVPLQDPEVAAGELEALMAVGTFAGVEIAASVNGASLGDDRFAPFWAAAEGSGAVVFIHPTTRGFRDAAFEDYYLWNLVGNPMETTIAAAHMVLAGVLERHPGLRVLLAHGGGALPALRGRIRHGWSALPVARARLREDPEVSLRRFYYDTVTHDPAVLRDLVAFAGADHVLLGSDYPFDMADARPADTVTAAGLGPDAERAVLGGNAARLLGLEVHR